MKETSKELEERIKKQAEQAPEELAKAKQRQEQSFKDMMNRKAEETEAVERQRKEDTLKKKSLWHGYSES